MIKVRPKTKFNATVDKIHKKIEEACNEIETVLSLSKSKPESKILEENEDTILIEYKKTLEALYTPIKHRH